MHLQHNLNEFAWQLTVHHLEILETIWNKSRYDMEEITLPKRISNNGLYRGNDSVGLSLNSKPSVNS